jgi:hypothetical protein
VMSQSGFLPASAVSLDLADRVLSAIHLSRLPTSAASVRPQVEATLVHASFLPLSRIAAGENGFVPQGIALIGSLTGNTVDLSGEITSTIELSATLDLSSDSV